MHSSDRISVDGLDIYSLILISWRCNSDGLADVATAPRLSRYGLATLMSEACGVLNLHAIRYVVTALKGDGRADCCRRPLLAGCCRRHSIAMLPEKRPLSADLRRVATGLAEEWTAAAVHLCGGISAFADIDRQRHLVGE